MFHVSNNSIFNTRAFVLFALIMLAVISVTPSAYAAEQNSGDTPVTATDVDPIVTFVQADHAQKAALLKNWPYSEASFTKLMELMDSEVLMKDADNTIYIIKNDVELFNYQTDEPQGDDWPASLETVSLNNQLLDLVATQAALKGLSSSDLSARAEAIAKVAEHPEAIELDTLINYEKSESDPELKAQFAKIIARKSLDSGTEDEKIAALKSLEESSDPEILAIINAALENPDTPKSLKKPLKNARDSIESRIGRYEFIGNTFSGLSMASILLLAALGLAITYGLLGVINMAHGELIMIGAYATYLTQSLFMQHLPQLSSYYLLAAIPAAFLASACVGILIERIVVRPLYGRELETLLATFGVSLILIQLTRMIFGAQNVAVESVSWLSGGIHLTESIILPYNRIAIIGFTVFVLLAVTLLISKTRFGLFVRAVTQNRTMARSVGVSSSKIDMMAFGLGSGIAGLAGCGLAQIGNVGPDLGQNLIVDTFLVVVVGGVGQIAGAALASIGLGVGGTFLEVGIGAVLAKITLLVLVILFIQKRPQGLFSIKGRFVDQ